MEGETIEFISGIILVSESPERLAEFYREVIGIPLESEAHEGTSPHWACDLGDIHFAIHPVVDFPDGRAGVGAVKIALNVFDIEALAERLEKAGVPLLYPPKDTGFFWSTAVLDLDGNLIEFTQMSDAWFKYLEHRRSQGADVLSRWKARQPTA
jgi:predicted enzyme related to lactoylglutathione lyase